MQKSICVLKSAARGRFRKLTTGEWRPWLKRNFKRSEDQAQKYMALARDAQNGSALPFSSLRDFSKRSRGSVFEPERIMRALRTSIGSRRRSVPSSSSRSKAYRKA